LIKCYSPHFRLQPFYLITTRLVTCRSVVVSQVVWTDMFSSSSYLEETIMLSMTKACPCIHVYLSISYDKSYSCIYVIVRVHWFVNSQQMLQVESLGKITWNDFAVAILNWKLHVGSCAHRCSMFNILLCSSHRCCFRSSPQDDGFDCLNDR
jgi:hypothetical protein